MTNFTDRIKPTHDGITTYLDNLLRKAYQIPTFQRDVVWDRQNVKKLWDSIYKFYPLGSILVWKTNIKLQNHRHIGGFEISDDLAVSEYQYILDGQQRTTSLLTSLFGGKIQGKEDFNPTLYIDLTVEYSDEIEDESYKKRFLFWDEIDDRNGELRANSIKKKHSDQGLIVKLLDVKQNFGSVERKLVDSGYTDYDHQYRSQLRRFKEVLDNYRISFIELKGIQVAEVCQIFERINQAGKPLNIFDIVVAKTFRPESDEREGFYIRELFDDFRKNTNGNFVHLDDITFLQMLAVIINQNVSNSNIYNITDRYLNELKTEHIESIWLDTKKAILKLFDFLENHMHLKGPQLIPYRYFYMTLVSYFYKNNSPDYEFLKKYFWYYCFHNFDLLSNTTQMWQHMDFLGKQKKNQGPQFERFLLDKNKLRQASYHSKSALSRAILALYANQEPKDWANTDRNVLAEVYYLLTDKPNLHHIFPLNYINENPGTNSLDTNSLMNIAYLTQLTNLQISDKNPIRYIKEYDTPDFEKIMPTHLLPKELLDWARVDSMPDDALDQFIEKRIDIIIEFLRDKLKGITFEIIDTK
jgi:hypothetical protein